MYVLVRFSEWHGEKWSRKGGWELGEGLHTVSAEAVRQGSKRVRVAGGLGASREQWGQRGPAPHGFVGFDSVCIGNLWRISSKEVT